jgi:hypothetical protein
MPPAAQAQPQAQDTRPLTAEERRVMNTLLARDSAHSAPAVRPGDPYVALDNLVVPRRGDPTHQGDLAMAGETVYLTEEEAQLFTRCDPGKDGRQVPVVQKLSGPGGTREPPARVLPRQVSGPVWSPGPPPPGSDGPRPDPPGSSRVQVMTDVRIPESAEPVPGSESEPGAVDIPPGTAHAPEQAVRDARERARRR